MSQICDNGLLRAKAATSHSSSQIVKLHSFCESLLIAYSGLKGGQYEQISLYVHVPTQ